MGDRVASVFEQDAFEAFEGLGAGVEVEPRDMC